MVFWGFGFGGFGAFWVESGFGLWGGGGGGGVEDWVSGVENGPKPRDNPDA